MDGGRIRTSVLPVLRLGYRVSAAFETTTLAVFDVPPVEDRQSPQEPPCCLWGRFVSDTAHTHLSHHRLSTNLHVVSRHVAAQQFEEIPETEPLDSVG